MTKKAAALTAEQEASYQAMADMTESDTTTAVAKGRALHGDNAAASGRAALLAAGLDPAELNRLIGGRPSLDPAAVAGKHSPHLNLRVSADLKKELVDLAAARNVRPSELARELLSAGVHELRRASQETQHRENIEHNSQTAQE